MKKKQLEILKKKNELKNRSEFYLALLFASVGITIGVISNVGANVFYDLFVKGNRVMEIGILFLVAFLLVLLVWLFRKSDKIIDRLKSEIKELEETK